MAKKLLIIEDEPLIAEMYQMKLKRSGYDVAIAYNGQEGLQACQNLKPDLILLDLRMPIMSGDKMLEELRKTDWGAKIRVIILTNISKDEAPHNLRLLSVDRYVVKAHSTPAQVAEIVGEILQTS